MSCTLKSWKLHDTHYSGKAEQGENLWNKSRSSSQKGSMNACLWFSSNMSWILNKICSSCSYWGQKSFFFFFSLTTNSDWFNFFMVMLFCILSGLDAMMFIHLYLIFFCPLLEMSVPIPASHCENYKGLSLLADGEIILVSISWCILSILWCDGWYTILV